MVFYFTATGNSLYVAKKLDVNPISIPQVMHTDKRSFEDDIIGIVFPDYAATFPKIVERFLEESTFKTNYFYMIITYGHDHSDSPEFCAKIAKKNGVSVDYIGTVKMVDNYLPVFDMTEEMAIDKNLDEQIKEQLQAITEQKREIPKATRTERMKHKSVTAMNKVAPGFNNGSQIDVTDACSGCGICEKVCPVSNFYLEDGLAKRRQSTCEFCLACAHNCPQKAIKLKLADKNPNARYRNEHISLQEIMDANNQTDR